MMPNQTEELSPIQLEERVYDFALERLSDYRSGFRGDTISPSQVMSLVNDLSIEFRMKRSDLPRVFDEKYIEAAESIDRLNGRAFATVHLIDSIERARSGKA